MRLIVTSDLHYNHPKSQALAEDIIREINRTGGDGLLLVGDTSVADGQTLEQCLTRFTIPGPRLFVCGNHELWTIGADSYAIYAEELPRRVRALGWQWLEAEPFVTTSAAVVGSVGWYDYSFAAKSLAIPKRFYAAKVSPGAAEALGGDYAELLEKEDDVTPRAREVVARWNDGKFVKLGRSDEAFLEELLARLDQQLTSLADKSHVIAAIHHLPFRALLPPPRSGQWDFTKAYLGSDRLGKLLRRFENVKQMFCGHSHLPAEAQVGPIHAVALGSGYRHKTFRTVEMAE